MAIMSISFIAIRAKFVFFIRSNSPRKHYLNLIIKTIGSIKLLFGIIVETERCIYDR
ncbi:hypothetical protein LCIT_01930 [Leuconostoc citreum]|uniref:Uncharacterized protein n=1 Tax=Leuconostoc citreum TaxID=33964 RepID=A0A5A5TX08_LEUCI|nr:hypothetical protein LCIT_01930 [Leuconostoc citreum]GDZ85504.1 hypothetical protein LCTS_07030 [Leuconostoc citreum]GEK60905.1 hypothetical protein LCI01_05410 [Leuconostoc citreum]